MGAHAAPVVAHAAPAFAHPVAHHGLSHGVVGHGLGHAVGHAAPLVHAAPVVAHAAPFAHAVHAAPVVHHPLLSTLLPTLPLLLAIWLRSHLTPTTMVLPTTTPRPLSASLRATMAPALLREATL